YREGRKGREGKAKGKEIRIQLVCDGRICWFLSRYAFCADMFPFDSGFPLRPLRPLRFKIFICL
ncbi:MAG: hypothetical protein ABIS45_06020, partial [Burkholderiales bacterium]